MVCTDTAIPTGAHITQATTAASPPAPSARLVAPPLSARARRYAARCGAAKISSTRDTTAAASAPDKGLLLSLKLVGRSRECGYLTTPRYNRMNIPSSVPVEKMRQILTEVLEAMESPKYAPKLDEAKEAAGNEMLKMMQMVFPAIVQIEIEVIKRHGFGTTRESIVHFTQMLRQMETRDSEIARLHAQIRSHYMPPVSISSTVDTSL